MTKEKKAINYFRSKYNCAQSVITVFGNEFGLSENDCLKVSCAFGGGMGRQQHTCGALTGALMVLGLKYGKALNDPEEKKNFTYSKARELFSEFKKLNGSTICLDLLNGLNMNDPVDNKKIKELKLFDIHCEKYVADAVKISEKLLEN
jgi:C_GCAxxG_C_C family probable redox protein